MNRRICKLLAGPAALLLTSLGIMLAGCSTPTGGQGTGPAPAGAKKSPPPGQSGAKLWAQNCGHCHNIRSPNSYSDAQWDVAMLHMRIRANLTADEHKQILAFLKSAH